MWSSLARLEKWGVSTAAAFAAVVILVALGAGALAVFGPGGGGGPGSSSSSTTAPSIQGIVTGYVTAGPSQPVCSENQTCNEDMSGYSLVFVALCGGPSSCQTESAPLNSAGHYSILLPPGDYSVTGLEPSCPWMGCSSAFPKSVTVQGGMQEVLNIGIDTGIR